MTRIGFIRNIVEQNGGNVAHYYANGSGSFGGFSNRGPNAGKVIYKVGVNRPYTEAQTPIEPIEYTNIIKQLVGNNDIERAYVSGGYLRIIFSTTLNRTSK